MTELTIEAISNNGKAIRTAGTVEEPLFMAKDVVEGVGTVWNGLTTIKHVPVEFRVLLDNTLPNGAVVKAWYLNELGLYFYLNRSDSSLALPWQIKVAETLKTIRQSTIPGPTSDYLVSRIKELETENHILQEIVMLHEGSDDLFDPDDVAGTLAIHKGPNFTPKAMRIWMQKRAIYTTLPFKNDRPRQEYINRGWFFPKPFHWKERGRMRHRIKHYLTIRGLHGLIRMAVKEKLLSLPKPEQRLLFDIISPEAGGPVRVLDYHGTEREIV